MLVTHLVLVGPLSFMGMLLSDVGRRDKPIAAVLLVCFLVCAGLALAGTFDVDPSQFPPPAIKAMNGFFLVLVASLFVPRTRRVWDAIPARRLILWHTNRVFLGAAAVLAASEGRLAPEFGMRAGWGDILAAVWAAAYVLVPPLRRVYGTLAWNLFSLLDGLVGAGTATLTLASPFQTYPHAEQMSLMNQFPLALVACFIVPLMFTSQFALFRKGSEPAEADHPEMRKAALAGTGV